MYNNLSNWFRLNMTKRLSDFYQSHKGENIVVCGCGTSLRDILEYKDNFITIGVNDVPAMFDPTYMVVTDHMNRFPLNRRKLVMESKCRYMFTCVKGWRRPNVVMFELGSRKQLNLDAPNLVDHYMNSPFVAANIAYKLGAKNIGLIGVDFTDNHFYARDGSHTLVKMKRLREVKEAYGILYANMKKNNVNLYNLSKDSKVDTIPKISIEEFKAL